MAQFEKKAEKAKELEAVLEDEGRYRDAAVVRALRLSAAAMQGVTKQLHKDNMELREKLGMGVD